MKYKYLSIVLAAAFSSNLFGQDVMGVSIEEAKKAGIPIKTAPVNLPKIASPAPSPEAKTVVAPGSDDASKKAAQSPQPQQQKTNPKPLKTATPVAPVAPAKAKTVVSTVDFGAPSADEKKPATASAEPQKLIEQKIAEALNGTTNRRTRDASSSSSGYGMPQEDRSVVNVRVGVTEIIPVAMNYLTRISTPFQSPKAKTINDVEIDVVGSTLFISPNIDGPIGIFVYDNDDPAVALTLQLVPQDIPQRDVTLRLLGGGGRSSSAGTGGWTEGGKASLSSQPYTATVVETFSELAKGKIPSGYTITQAQGNEIDCQMPGFSVRLGQMIDGSQYRVAVFLVQNVTSKAIEIDEQLCHQSGVAGVATWPYANLEAGQKTELYLMFKQQESTNGVLSQRPSLLGQ